MLDIRQETFGTAWHSLLGFLYTDGKPSSPRNLNIKEFLGVRLTVEEGLSNVLVSHGRNPNYRFMIAEWLWMYFGHNDVVTIAQYNPHIAKFSDNGVDFNGAYGVPIARQWQYVRGLLRQDENTRQAVMVIYAMPTAPTKDVPCTVSCQFLIREGRLNAIVTMRSSDIWLGLPYDFFNFSMLLNCMSVEVERPVGFVQFNLGSSHLYETNDEQALSVIQERNTYSLLSPQFLEKPPSELNTILLTKRYTSSSHLPYTRTPWSLYAAALVQERNADALDGMRMLHDHARASR